MLGRRRRSARRELQLGRPADPLEQLFPLPRSGQCGARGGPASRRRGLRDRGAAGQSEPLRDRSRQARIERADQARDVDESGFPDAAAANAPRARGRRGRDARALDRGRCRVPAALVVHRAGRGRGAANRAPRPRRQRDRLVRVRGGRAPTAHAVAGGGSGDADPAGHVHVDGLARDAGGSGGVRRGHRSGRVRARRRPAARVAGLRRAHGERMARRRAVRRFRRLPRRRVPTPSLSVARLGDRGLQPQPALRRLRVLAARGRSPTERHTRAAARDGLRTSAPAQRGKRHRRRGVPDGVRDRPHRHARHRVPRPIRGLRALPRSQVRSDQPRRLLLARGVFQ